MQEQSYSYFTRGAKFAGPENNGPRKNNDWKLQYLENYGHSLLQQLVSIIMQSRRLV